MDGGGVWQRECVVQRHWIGGRSELGEEIKRNEKSKILIFTLLFF